MDHLQRFLDNMEYTPADRVPNWEAGVWPQTAARWEEEGLDPASLHWDWFPGEASLGMDPREFIYFTAKMIPAFAYEELAEDEATVTFRDEKGIVDRPGAHVDGRVYRFPGGKPRGLGGGQEALLGVQPAAVRAQLGRHARRELAQPPAPPDFRPQLLDARLLLDRT
jgi:hypothetical protein